MLRPGRRTRRLGELLVARGDCTAQRVEEALGHQVVYDGRLGTNLLELGAVTEEQVARGLSAQHGLPARWGEIEVEEGALAMMAPAVARRCQAVPLRLGRRRLGVLVSDVRDPTRLDEISFAVGKEAWPVLVTESRLWELLRRHYGVPCPRRSAAEPRRGQLDRVARLASHQELLAELQQDASRRYLAGGLTLLPDGDEPAPAARARR